MSYTVYARARPIRMALVLDQTALGERAWHCDALLDGIVSSAIETWGGRNHPIVLIEGDEDLASDEWKVLEAADPDCVQAFAPLSNVWVERFDSHLMPWTITKEKQIDGNEPKAETLEKLWRWLPVTLPNFATPPRPEILKKYRCSKLLMIEFSKECPLEIRRFFDRNFGTFYQWFDQGQNVRRVGWLEDMLAGVDLHIVRIADMDSACAAMRVFAGSLRPPKPCAPLSFVAPTEISAFGLNDGYSFHVYAHTYRLFVGDSLCDFSAYWNELRLCRCCGVPHRNALWVPTTLTRSASFIEALAALVYEYSGQHSSGSRSIEVTSETLSLAELETLCSELRKRTQRCPARPIDSQTRRSRLRQSLCTEFEESRPIARLNSGNSERLRIAERSEVLRLTEPGLLMSDGNWAVDVQVDFGASHRFNTPRW
jgi:hypothetical protein